MLLATDLPGLTHTKLFDDPHFSGEHSGLEDTRLEAANLKQHHLFEYDGFLSDLTIGDPLDIALDYLSENASLLGLETGDLQNVIFTDQYVSDHTGVTHIYLQQTFAGLDVVDANLNINITADGQVINVGSTFLPDLETSGELESAPVPVISALDAVEAFADTLHLPLESTPTILESTSGVTQSMVLSGSGLSLDDIPASLHYVQTGEGELELSWNLEVRTSVGNHWYDASVSATDGELLSLVDWIDHAADQYRVFALPLASPDEGNRTLETDPADTTASPFGWHDINGVAGAEFTDTRGNNVVATIDRRATSMANGFRPDGGAALEFDFALDLSQEPINNQAAAVTNLFYWNNILHDIHYQYGFNEAAGNFQVSNFGNGGLGGDQVQAEAQFGAEAGRFNNAFFGTPPDGRVPQMAMFEFNRTIPGRDSDFDNGVIIHEYGHGISNRLTGGPSNAGALEAVQSGGMGEGWGDWWALMLAAEPGDRRNDAHGLGAYGLGQPPNSGGFRRQPFSFDMTINPVTYATFNLSNEVHDAGEIWATALWDLNWLLIDGDGGALPARGYDPDLYNGTGGNNLALQLVMDGLKLQPANPSFLDARDAILMADRVSNNGANQLAIWTAFARRGMGFSANDGGSSAATSVTEAFDLPAISGGTVVLDQESYEVGDTVRITLRDIDLTGSGTFDVSLTSNSGDTETVSLPETGTGLFQGSIATGPGGASADGILNVAAGDRITVTYNDANDGSGNTAVVEDMADILALVDVFRQDFESGLGNSETVSGGFSINNSNATLNNGSMMMGHSSNHGDLEYSFYELTVDLRAFEDGLLRFDFAAQLEDGFDGFNVQASTSALAPPLDLISPIGGMSYDNLMAVPQPALGAVAYDSNGLLDSGTATFDLSPFDGQVVNLRLQFGSDQSVTNPGINIDNLAVRAVPTAGVAGTVSFDSETYRFGDVVTVTVRDADLSGTGQIDLPLFADNGDRETVNLFELTAGVFQGSIRSSRSGVVSDGTINPVSGGSIMVAYLDADDGTGNTAEVSDEAQFVAAVGSVAFGADLYEVGATVTVMVVDADLAGSGQVSLSLISSGGDSETISAVEGGAGVFQGSIATSAAGTPADGTLNANPGDVITVTYNDADDGTGNPSVVTDTANIISMLSIFSQDFESGLGSNESVFGAFTINNSNTDLNNGTSMMGQPGFYGDFEYSFYELILDLTAFRDVVLQFEYAAQIEDSYDRFNVQASTAAIAPPDDLIAPISGLPYDAQGASFLPQIGPIGYDGNGVLDTGTAVFDLSAYDGQTVNLRFQFGSDESLTNPGINIDNVFVLGELAAGRAGTADFDAESYQVNDDVTVTIRDRDLVGAGPIEVAVVSSSGDTETISAVETATGIFRGTIASSPVGTVGDGTLNADAGDRVTVTYNDADDGTGNPAVVTDTADFIALFTVFSQDFESGLGSNERVFGGFAINNSNFSLNNGTLMMGHPNFHGNLEYSYYELTLDLTEFQNAELRFEYASAIEGGYDAFNVQASTSTISPPGDLISPTSGLPYQNLLSVPQSELGPIAYSPGFLDFGTATFDLAPFAGQEVDLRFQFGSDEFLFNAGINIDNLLVQGQLLGSSTGAVAFDQDAYEVGDIVNITVRDSDLIGSGSLDVEVASSGGDSETLNLIESGAGVFAAGILTTSSGSSGDGLLNVTVGDAIAVAYNDADDGTGSPAVVTDVAAIVSLVDIFSQDFESGLGSNETTSGAFTINNSNTFLNNGTMVMGHPGDYGDNEYSFYELTLDLTDFSNVELQFEFTALLEDTFDGFNVQAGVPPLAPPGNLIEPVAGMNYEVLGGTVPAELGQLAYDSDGGLDLGVAMFNLSAFDGQVIAVRLQFGSDEFLTNPGINIDNLLVRGSQALSATLTVDNAIITEESGSATVTVELETPASAPTTVDFSLSGTATLSSDYLISATQVIIPAGATTGSTTLTALQDAVAEGSETVIVTIAGSASTESVMVSILDDDLRVIAATGIDGINPLAIVELDLPSAKETPIGSTSLNLGLDIDPVSGLLFGASNELRSINTSTGETRTIGSIDSATTTGITMASISFAPDGTLYGVASATASDDHMLYTIETATGAATAVGEIDTGVRGIEFALDGTLYGAYDDLFMIDPNDAMATPIGSLEFAVRELDASSNGQLIAVGILRESQSLFLINTADAAQSVLGTFDSELSSVATQGGQSTVSLSVDNVEIPEDRGVATFTATLSAPAVLPVSIELAFTGTATLADDYNVSATTIEIPVGATTGSVTVTALRDAAAEENETVAVDVANVVGAVESETQRQVTTIVDGGAGTTFTVTAAVATSSGFAVAFNAALDSSELSLYGLGDADVTLIGDVSGPVPGSLVVDASLRSVFFVKTGDPLVPDTYTATLRSGGDGFKDAAGNLLDGNGDGTAGDDFSAAFTIDPLADSAVTVGISDFVRGPGQPVNLPTDALGIPVVLNQAEGQPSAREVDFQLNYDPALLQITGASASGGASVSIDTSTPGLAMVSFASTSDLPAGDTTVLNFIASVPTDNASGIYGRSQLLDIHSVAVRDASANELPVVGDDAVHLVSFFGDVSGNGRINASDAAQVARIAALLDAGFAATPLTDPGIVGDISGNGRVNAADASLVARSAALIEVPQIPPIPGEVAVTGLGVAHLGPGLPDLELPERQVAWATSEATDIQSSGGSLLPQVGPDPYQAVDTVMASMVMLDDIADLRLVTALEDAMAELLSAELLAD